MIPVATPAFDLIALVVSTAIFSLALGFVQALVAQALERPYRLRQPEGRVPTRLRVLPGTAAAPRAVPPRFAEAGLDLPGAA